jgi:hypothetical protein
MARKSFFDNSGQIIRDNQEAATSTSTTKNVSSERQPFFNEVGNQFNAPAPIKTTPTKIEAQPTTEKKSIFSKVKTKALNIVGSFIPSLYEGLGAAGGAIVGGVSSAIGFGVGEIGEGIKQNVNLLKGKGYDVKKIFKTATEQAKESYKFGAGIGKEGTQAAPVAIVAPIAFDALMIGTVGKNVYDAMQTVGYQSELNKLNNTETADLALKELGKKGWTSVGFDQETADKIADNPIFAASGLVINTLMAYAGSRGVSNRFFTGLKNGGVLLKGKSIELSSQEFGSYLKEKGAKLPTDLPEGTFTISKIEPTVRGKLVQPIEKLGATKINIRFKPSEGKAKPLEIRGEVPADLRTTYEKLNTDLVKLENRNNPIMTKNLLTVKNQLEIYNNANKENVLIINGANDAAPLVNLDIVKMSDGKYAYSYDVNVQSNGLNSDFLSNEVKTNRQEAINAAKAEIINWVKTEMPNVVGQDRADLQTIIGHIEQINPNLNIPVEVKPPTEKTQTKERFIYHGTERTVDEVVKKGVYFTEKGVLGKAYYMTDATEMSEKYGSNVIKLNPSDFNLLTVNSLQEKDNLIKETKTSSLAEAVKEKGYDGFIFTNPNKEVGNTYGIINKEKIDQIIKEQIGGQTKTQKEKVTEAVKEKPKTIKEISEETKILEPNVRRILGVGAKEGTFERVDKGVYILRKDGKDIAYIETGDAVKVLPRLAKEGTKADMVFLDIPYKTPSVAGGNRGAKFEFITVEQFGTVVDAVKEIARDEKTPVFYMFSQAPSGIKEMQKYTDKMTDAGFKPVARGEYTKLQKDGITRTRNMRGVPDYPEGIILFTKSGEFDKENPDLNFKLIRPKGYQTEKPAELAKALVEMGTEEGEVVLDPFAGSGVVPAEAVKAGRKAVAIEKSEKAVEEFIKPRVEAAAKQYPTIHEGGKVKMVEGELVEIVKGVKTFLHKGDNGWIVSESTTGRYIAESRSREGVLAKAEFMIDDIGINNFKEAIAKNQLKQPRFSKKQTETVLQAKEPPKAPTGAGQADVGTFQDNTPVILGGIDKIRPIETPELVNLVNELTGKFPIVNKRLRTKLGVFWGRGAGEIQLRPDIFKDPIQVQKVLAHEIGHLVDYLPPLGIRKSSLLQKLYIIKNHLKTEFGEEFIKNQQIKDELWALSTYWRPLGDNPSAGFLKYRKSGSELYADAISVLFNSPGLLEQKAPTFYKAFFASLDQKPDVNEKYWEIQDLLHGAKDELYEARENRIKKGFAKAEDIQKGFKDKKENAVSRLGERLRQQLDDRYWPINKKVNEAEAMGKIIDDSANPKYLLQELPYINNDNYLLVDKLNKEVSEPVRAAGMNDDDIGIYLLLDRIQTGRKDIANPFGFDVNNAKEQLDYLKTRVGDDNFKLLQDKVKLFHDEVFKSVEKAVEVGTYNKEIFETTIKPNKENYATFAVVDYLQDYVPATVKKQVGTLKEVANPYHLTILKTAALNKLNALQEAKNSVRGLLEQGFPDEIVKLRPTKFTRTRERNPKLFQLLEDGKVIDYEVDPYIARSFEHDNPDDLNVAINLLQKINQNFKSIVTTYNLGFALAFNPIRDFKRNYKNIPNASILNLIKAYVESFPSAVKYAKGQLDSITKQMVADKLINAPIYDYNFDPRDDGMGAILEKYGVITRGTPERDLPVAMKQARRFLLRPLIKVLEAIRFTANTFENISKVAATKVRMKSGETGKELAYNIRNFSGTPNWKVRGTHTETTNEVFIFSNIMKEGLKSDFIIATDPKTRSGYWWKTAKVDFIPKFLMFLAAAGLFGSKVKELYDKMTEYDKTNYITIPIGEHNGKAVYMRIPHDETGRIFSAILWKALNFMKDHNINNLQDILSIGAGQLPNVTPVITILEGWGQYLTGRNPYDAFRGRTLIDDTTFQAGGFAALKKMVQWTANTFGLSQFTTYDPIKNDTLETSVQILPLINRLFKISDYGLTEQSKELQGEIKAERAKEIIKEKEVISRYVKKYKDDYKSGDIDIYTIGDEIVKEVLGHEAITDEELSRDKSMRTRLKTALIVGAYDARVDTLVYSTSNREKIALLKKYQEEMPIDQFDELIDILYDEKIVSGDVLEAIGK